MKNKFRLILAGAACLISSMSLAQNPYLPLWEHIPDGEPYVFEDPDKPGEYRVYIYGSHDSLIKAYCGREQVVWSASVNDLKNWRYDGVIFEPTVDANGNKLHEDGLGDVLFAPDVMEYKAADGSKTYYLYPNTQNGGRQGTVAKSSRPDGPFEICNWNPKNPRETVGDLRFDPAVFQDEDGKVYGYWGFEESNGAELDPATMATIKPGGKYVRCMISDCKHEGEFRFFEASSIRKIKDKYVFIYSRMTANGEFGLPTSNYTLAYAYSDYPLGPFTYGGTIIDGRARGKNANGEDIATATPYGNTHGSICEINGQWYVFYHRQSGTTEYSRQAMVAPIEVSVTEGLGGKVTISEAEYTSEGFELNGLHPYTAYPAGIACFYLGKTTATQDYPNVYYSGSHFEATYITPDESTLKEPYKNNDNYNPVVNNNDGSIVGYKYFNMDELDQSKSNKLMIRMQTTGVKGSIKIMLDSPWESQGGIEIGNIKLGKKMDKPAFVSTSLKMPKVSGKHAIFMVFTSPTPKESLGTMYTIQFSK
ncbi:MAG: family 43 glycosylhydrolase [Marinilabiliaceae bacterium]|nr:family 43 glycosylhydrolase [Marinilabiliaceae bacterium]